MGLEGAKPLQSPLVQQLLFLIAFASLKFSLSPKYRGLGGGAPSLAIIPPSLVREGG